VSSCPGLKLNSQDSLETFALHAAIYNARSDVGAVIDGHTPYGKAFSRQNKTISMMVQGGSVGADT
jgi:ribulose-5-phosphate 4-epimerase/fuculose-1-phosphate aldolase